jgi:hypothetical protein
MEQLSGKTALVTGSTDGVGWLVDASGEYHARPGRYRGKICHLVFELREGAYVMDAALLVPPASFALCSAARQFPDWRHRRAGFEQCLEARQDFWPANGNRTDELGIGLIDFVGDRQPHDFAGLPDVHGPARVALFVQIGPELVAPSRMSRFGSSISTISPMSATRPSGKTSFRRSKRHDRSWPAMPFLRRPHDYCRGLCARQRK